MLLILARYDSFKKLILLQCNNLETNFICKYHFDKCFRNWEFLKAFELFKNKMRYLNWTHFAYGKQNSNQLWYKRCATKFHWIRVSRILRTISSPFLLVTSRTKIYETRTMEWNHRQRPKVTFPIIPCELWSCPKHETLPAISNTIRFKNLGGIHWTNLCTDFC